jgi:HPt (histidine-containing phosphotransfer) domain-containing protein
MDSVIKRYVRDDNHEEVPVTEEPSDNEKEDEDIEIEIPGVDTKKGLFLYAGEKKVYLPLLRSYAANTPEILDKMRVVTAENLADYTITVHGLKGTSAGIGAERIREEALNLETMCRAGDLRGVLELNGKLISDTEVVLENIGLWLKRHDVHNAKPRLKAPDRELLARLRRSCESYDMSGIDEAMSELEKADYEEDAELMAWLRKKINISRMGEAAKRLADEGFGE